MSSTKNTYQITATGQASSHTFELLEKDAQALDVVTSAEGDLHILQNGKAHVAEIVATNFAKKTARIRVNETVYTVSIANHYDQLVKQLGLSVVSSQKVNEIKAPMPGLVLSIEVEIGQSVEKGDPLLILEAMKMENVIKSPGEGIVKAIAIDKGAAVDKGEVMIEFE